MTSVHELALYVCLRVRGIRMVRFLRYPSNELFLWPEENVFLTDRNSVMKDREKYDVVGVFSYSDFEEARSRYGFFNAFNTVYLNYVFSNQNRSNAIAIAQLISNARFLGGVVRYERILVKKFFYFIIYPSSIIVNILYILSLR
jgi:hypothetical protein